MPFGVNDGLSETVAYSHLVVNGVKLNKRVAKCVYTFECFSLCHSCAMIYLNLQKCLNIIPKYISVEKKLKKGSFFQTRILPSYTVIILSVLIITYFGRDFCNTISFQMRCDIFYK